jgi:hypothetical protein
MIAVGIVVGTVLEQVSTQRAEFLIIEDMSNPKYPNKVACEFFGDKNTKLLDDVNEGDLVRVDGQIKSREWEGKWFTNFSCFALWPLDRATTRSKARDGGARSGPSRGRDEPPPPGDDDDLAF